MPAFPGVVGSSTVQAALCSLGRGEAVYLFGTAPAAQAIDDSNVVNETILAGIASVSVALTSPCGGPSPMVCIEIAFSAAPGTFEIDIQEADTNADAAFITPTNVAYTVTAVITATNRARVDLSPTGGKFIRVFVKTLTNAVTTRCKITRLA
jgi:hypothetical protein